MSDDTAFNDPEAWGYCEVCCFIVAAKHRRRFGHRYERNGVDDQPCSGSYKKVTMEAPVEATPRIRLSLKKDTGRSASRSFWQKRRTDARTRKSTRLKPIRVAIDSEVEEECRE